MTKTSIILASILYLLSLNLSATEEYRGMISSTIVEPNGHVYMGDEGFTSGGVFTDKQVIYFSQERGQKITMTKQNIVFDSSRNRKYHLVLEIIERKDEKFKAKVSFYQNAMSETVTSNSTPGNSTLISKVIRGEEIEGVLNTENSYVFIDDNKANLKLSINIDRVFSDIEIKERLKKELENRRVAKEQTFEKS